MTISLRAAQRGDVPDILAMIAELAAYERLADQARASEDDLAEHLFGAHRAAEACVAEADGAPVGFALWFTTFSTFTGRPGLWLEDLYVRPAARGSGVGSALFRHCTALAAARGCGRMEWSVLKWNAPALALYRARGAVSMDDWQTMRLDGAALRAAGAAPA